MLCSQLDLPKASQLDLPKADRVAASRIFSRIGGLEVFGLFQGGSDLENPWNGLL